MSGKERNSGGKAGRSGTLLNVILIAALLVGIGLIAYPSVSNWWNSMHQSRAVASYISTVNDLSASEDADMLTEAEAYNRRLRNKNSRYILSEEEEEEYRSILDVTGTGIMAYVQIPKIHVNLPIYHGTDEGVLEIAIGHIEGTSLPVGGKGTHCVISGHRGLPSARLFTDLPKLVDGDTFTITVLDRTLTYQVDQIRTVEPTDLSDLEIDPEQDYCTLVTCTPYGVNTHRLLVRGHRVANAQGDAEVVADAMQIETIYVAPFLAVPILILLAVIMLLMTGRIRAGNAAYREAMAGAADGRDTEETEVPDEARREIGRAAEERRRETGPGPDR